jgi:hypothetical protein
MAVDGPVDEVLRLRRNHTVLYELARHVFVQALEIHLLLEVAA